jgi:hypothetical protein
LDFYLNANMIDPRTATRITDVLQGALNVLKKRAAASAYDQSLNLITEIEAMSHTGQARRLSDVGMSASPPTPDI